jgi:hypothetical protein
MTRLDRQTTDGWPPSPPVEFFQCPQDCRSSGEGPVRTLTTRQMVRDHRRQTFGPSDTVSRSPTGAAIRGCGHDIVESEQRRCVLEPERTERSMVDFRTCEFTAQRCPPQKYHSEAVASNWVHPVFVWVWYDFGIWMGCPCKTASYTSRSLV